MSSRPRPLVVAPTANAVQTRIPVYRNLQTIQNARATGNRALLETTRLQNAIGVVSGAYFAPDLFERAAQLLPTLNMQLTLYDRSDDYLDRGASANLTGNGTSVRAITAVPPSTTLVHGQTVKYSLATAETHSEYFQFNTREYELVCVPAAVRFNEQSLPIIVSLLSLLFFFTVGVMLWSTILGRFRLLRKTYLLKRVMDARANAIELLQAARRDADEANHSKSNFMSYLCHELRCVSRALPPIFRFFCCF